MMLAFSLGTVIGYCRDVSHHRKATAISTDMSIDAVGLEVVREGPQAQLVEHASLIDAEIIAHFIEPPIGGVFRVPINLDVSAQAVVSGDKNMPCRIGRRGPVPPHRRAPSSTTYMWEPSATGHWGRSVD